MTKRFKLCIQPVHRHNFAIPPRFFCRLSLSSQVLLLELFNYQAPRLILRCIRGVSAAAWFGNGLVVWPTHMCTHSDARISKDVGIAYLPTPSPAPICLISFSPLAAKSERIIGIDYNITAWPAWADAATAPISAPRAAVSSCCLCVAAAASVANNRVASRSAFSRAILSCSACIASPTTFCHHGVSLV